MEKLNKQSYDDELRRRFNAWLDKLLWRARADYVRMLGREVKTVSIDDVDESLLAVEDRYAGLQSEFEIEEKRLAEAFFSLPILRQKILTMLFVDGMKPAEIAEILHCSKEHVAMQRFRALEKLRQILDEEDFK